MKIQEMLNKIIEVKKLTKTSNLLGVNRSTVYRTLKGETVPSYALGKAIEALYNEVMNQK